MFRNHRNLLNHLIFYHNLPEFIRHHWFRKKSITRNIATLGYANQEKVKEVMFRPYFFYINLTQNLRLQIWNSYIEQFPHKWAWSKCPIGHLNDNHKMDNKSCTHSHRKLSWNGSAVWLVNSLLLYKIAIRGAWHYWNWCKTER